MSRTFQEPCRKNTLWTASIILVNLGVIATIVGLAYEAVTLFLHGGAQ